MQIKISMQDAAFSAFASRLAKMGSQGKVELARGLNEAGDQIRTIVRRRLRHQMNTTTQEVIERHTGSRSASPGHLTYEITGDGAGLPIKNFPYAVPGNVSAQPWGTAHTFKRSFGVSGLLMARLPKSAGSSSRTGRSYKTRWLLGPAPRKELVVGETAEAFMHNARALVLPILTKRLARLLP